MLNGHTRKQQPFSSVTATMKHHRRVNAARRRRDAVGLSLCLLPASACYCALLLPLALVRIGARAISRRHCNNRLATAAS